MKKRKILYLVLGSVAIVVIALYFANARLNRIKITSSTIDTMAVVEVAPLEFIYGIPKDSFLIEEYGVQRNQNISDILLRSGVDYPTINGLVLASDKVFDVRKLQVGRPYTLFFTPDSLHRLRHFVYGIDDANYLVLSLGDSLTASLRSKPVREVDQIAAATIESSLWNAIAGKGLSPSLAIELSEIFAWTVDFFGIEKGDYFKVLYQERFVDSTSIGVGEIKAALFHHRHRKYYAFHFDEDGEWNYFDEQGNSLRKAFLKAPLKFSRISSRFSSGRLHPVLKIRRPHHGVDYAAAAGTPVYAIGDGRVSHKGWDAKGGGNYLKITHNSVYVSVYMHLKGFAAGLTQGKQVKQGELIGFVGSTGLSTGPHLDFRVFKNNRPIDPLKMEAPSVEPIKAINKNRYEAYADSLKQIIDRIKHE